MAWPALNEALLLHIDCCERLLPVLGQVVHQERWRRRLPSLAGDLIDLLRGPRAHVVRRRLQGIGSVRVLAGPLRSFFRWDLATIPGPAILGLAVPSPLHAKLLNRRFLLAVLDFLLCLRKLLETPVV